MLHKPQYDTNNTPFSQHGLLKLKNPWLLFIVLGLLTGCSYSKFYTPEENLPEEKPVATAPDKKKETKKQLETTKLKMAESKPVPATPSPRIPFKKPAVKTSKAKLKPIEQTRKEIAESVARINENASIISGEMDELFFVKKLLFTSSAALKIKSGDHPGALQEYATALTHYEQALQARKVGDKQAVTANSNKAKLILFTALRLIPNTKRLENKDKQEYKRRNASIKALLKAQQRIFKEKHGDAEPTGDVVQMTTIYENSKKAYAKGDFNMAVKLANATLAALKRNIQRLREGDTLTRSLNFATPNEEYLYEIDRNDTHIMLVAILLKDKMNDPDTVKRVNANMSKAQDIRSQAEKLAEQGDMKAAIQKLEASTKQIVRAIRAAGIYIPG